jgi:hypothetical protein
MMERLRRIVTWFWEHPWQAAIRTILAGVIVGVLTEAITNGAKSYVLSSIQSIIFGWHQFPTAAWILVLPICGLGFRWIWETFRQPVEMPNESYGLRWRCQWNGRTVAKIEPICPNPNCGRDLTVVPTDKRYGSSVAFVCNPGCGFLLQYRDAAPKVLAEVRRDLEGQAKGKPPADLKLLKLRFR